MEERHAFMPERGGGDGRVHEAHDGKARGPGHAQQEGERGAAPEARHGQEGLGGLVAGGGPKGDELGVGEIGSGHALRERPAGGRGVERIPIRVVYEPRLETCFRRRVRPHEQAAPVEQGDPRARGQGMAGPSAESHQTGVVHLDGERAHRIRLLPGSG
jgi:hypothetical protein